MGTYTEWLSGRNNVIWRPANNEQQTLQNSFASNSFFYLLQVVDRIREVAHRTRLLVVDRDTDEYLLSCGLACTEDLAVEMGNLSPRPSPGPTPSISPVPRENSPLSSKPKQTRSFSTADLPTHMMAHGKVKRSSLTSSTTTDTEVRLPLNSLASSLWSYLI